MTSSTSSESLSHPATAGASPVLLDGSFGEGGGQILRTSLSLSALTGRPLRLEKIRAGREKPGLKRQHLTAVKAAAAVCGARVEGAELGSMALAFDPGAIRKTTNWEVVRAFLPDARIERTETPGEKKIRFAFPSAADGAEAAPRRRCDAYP